MIVNSKILLSKRMSNILKRRVVKNVFNSFDSMFSSEDNKKFQALCSELYVLFHACLVMSTNSAQ